MAARRNLPARLLNQNVWLTHRTITSHHMRCPILPIVTHRIHSATNRTIPLPIGRSQNIGVGLADWLAERNGLNPLAKFRPLPLVAMRISLAPEEKSGENQKCYDNSHTLSCPNAKAL